MAEVDGIWFSESGAGHVVVVPRLNIDWAQVDLTALNARVVIVAPRGFGPSARPGAYDGAGFVADVERVLDGLGIEEYAAFGYSMNGVMAARLAIDNPRVTAVAIGGFPLTADLSHMGARARGRNDAAREDPETWAEVTEAYDPAAAEAFWDDIAALPRGALAALNCPTIAWWGDQDAVLGSLMSSVDLARDLEERGIERDVLPGLDHDTALASLPKHLPRVAEWLAARLA